MQVQPKVSSPETQSDGFPSTTFLENRLVQFSVSSLCFFPCRHKKEKKKDKDRERERERRSDRDYSRDDREEQHSNSKKKKSKDKDRERKSDGVKGDVKVGVLFDSRKPSVVLACES